MFGREYANHLDILTLSFEQMNDQYRKQIKSNNEYTFIEKLKKIYILAFGIPEIAFQIRSMHFKEILTSYLLNDKLTKILDAGSGIGTYTFWLGKTFTKAKVTGGEIDNYKIQTCKALANELKIKNVEFKYLNITKTNNKPIFDLIVCIDVLEHIHNYESVLKNFSKLLKNDGYLYIHVPQPNQKRIFSSLKKWYHEDHVHEGISKNTLENALKKLGFKVILSRETLGFFGKLAWELNHLTLSKSIFIASIIYPLLYVIAKMDLWFKNKNGLCLAVLAKKK